MDPSVMIEGIIMLYSDLNSSSSISLSSHDIVSVLFSFLVSKGLFGFVFTFSFIGLVRRESAKIKGSHGIVFLLFVCIKDAHFSLRVIEWENVYLINTP